MKHLAIITLVASLLLVTGCPGGASFQHPTPKGFVELDHPGGYDYRAITADGMVLAARAIEHSPKGEVEFWSQAVRNQMRRRGAYALLSEAEVTTRTGLVGKQMRFGHDEGKRPHLYYVTLFVTEDTIYLLEAGGTKEQVEAHADQIDWAVTEFRIDG